MSSQLTTAMLPRRTSETRPSVSSRITITLIGCYFLGSHLRLSLQTGSGDILVPMYSMLVPAALLAVMNLGQLTKRVAPPAFLLVLFFLGLHPLLTMAAPGASDLLSTVQLVVSLLAAVSVIEAARNVPRNSLRLLFQRLWMFYMGIAALEIVALSSQFAQIKQALYGESGRGIYESDLRDLALYGQVRPTALASEPSFLADSYMVAALMVFLLDPDRGSLRSWFRLFLMAGVGFTVAPSGKVAFYLVAAATWHFWPRRSTAQMGAALLGIATVAVLWFAYATISSALSGRLGLTETGSFYGRVLVGPRVGQEALVQHPLMGWGIGNTDGLETVIKSEWFTSGAFAKFPWFQGMAAEQLLSNGFWWQWSFLGLLGGAVFIGLLTSALRRLDIDAPFRCVVPMWIVWYAGAAFVDPASWLALTVFAIPALAVSAKEPPQRSTRPRST